MDVRELRPGLWRWTAPHPDWKSEAGGWGRMVGCVSYEPSATLRTDERSFVLIDPLAPPAGSPEAEAFWRHLDADVARIGLPVAILIGNEFHTRSAQAVFDRYRPSAGASIWAHEATASASKCRVTNTFAAPRTLPSGVVLHAIGNPSPGEVAYYVPAHRALVVADALIGDGKGRVRVPPASWAETDPKSQEFYHADFRRSLRSLLDLPIDLLVPSHGDPIQDGARDAIEEALGAPALGDTA